MRRSAPVSLCTHNVGEICAKCAQQHNYYGACPVIFNKDSSIMIFINIGYCWEIQSVILNQDNLIWLQQLYNAIYVVSANVFVPAKILPLQQRV